MKYNELQVSSNKSAKRVGRGISAGQGKTAGRGTKGQGARTGKKLGPTFSSNQEHILSGIPKNRGFRSLRAKAQVIYTDQLNDVKGTTIDSMVLFEAGLIATPYHTVKLIVRGEYKGKANVKLQAASANAVEMLTKAGATFEAVKVPKLPASNREREEKRTEKAEKRGK